MTPRIKNLYLFFVLILSFMLTVQPVSALTIGEEREIGQKLLYTIRKQFSLQDDPDISQYVNRLGHLVLDEAGPQYFDYHFFVVSSEEFNAFAAPSGLIFFYSGLIEKMKTEDELVSVMAHEVGHVVSRHLSSRASKGAKVGAVSMALALASLAIGDPSLASGLFTGFQAAGQATQLHFSRIDEEEADRLSYGWLKDLGRNPEAMVGMLKVMRRITRYRSEQMPQYLLTHPNPEGRLEYVQSLLDYERDANLRREYKEPDNFEFLRIKYRLLVNVKDSEELRAYLTGIVMSSTDTTELAMANYGLALLEAKELNFSDAIEKFVEVKNTYPDRNILDVDLGVMYMDSGQFDRGYELLEQAYNRDTNDMYAAFHLAGAYEKKGRINDAESLYTKIMLRLPEYSQVYFELGRIESGKGHTNESHFYLGKYYMYEGKMGLARDYLQKAKNGKSVSQAMKEESDQLLKIIKDMEKK